MKYEVGDHIIKIDGGQRIITKVLPEGHEFDYGVRKLSGYKEYVLKENQIVGLYGELDPKAVKAEAIKEKREQSNNVGADQVLALAEKYEGTPDGDRWLKLSTIKAGDPIRIISLGKPVTATFLALRTGKGGRLLKEWPFAAKLSTGGEYRWQLDDIILDGQTVPEPKLTMTAPPLGKAGTIGELQAQINHLISVQHLDPDTKLLIASDGEGNRYNTLFNVQVERNNKAVIINVMEEGFGIGAK